MLRDCGDLAAPACALSCAACHAAALERLAQINTEALGLAEVLDYFAGVLRGARLGPDGPPLEALPSSDDLLAGG